MTKKKLFVNVSKMFLTVFVVVCICAATAFADTINLDMQGTTASIPKGNTVDRSIYGIPAGIPGTLKFKMKWHAVNIIPTFNSLKIQVKHGSSTLKTTTCYSIHSKKSPDCDFTINVSQTEAEKSGTWRLTITNNSGFEVVGFNIEKGSDLNPFVPNFKSTYTPNCPNTVNLDMEGTTLTLTKGGIQERKIFGIGNAAGVLKLKAKWHAVHILPAFSPLKIELLKPNGQVAKSGNYYSIHASNNIRGGTKIDLTYNISAADAALPGNWKLRITNNGNYEAVGFNIEKESGEINPLVPSFFSSYKANCNF